MYTDCVIPESLCSTVLHYCQQYLIIFYVAAFATGSNCKNSALDATDSRNWQKREVRWHVMWTETRSTVFFKFNIS